MFCLNKSLHNTQFTHASLNFERFIVEIRAQSYYFEHKWKFAKKSAERPNKDKKGSGGKLSLTNKLNMARSDVSIFLY